MALKYGVKVRPSEDGPRVVFEVDTDEATALKVLELLKEASCTK